MVKKKTKRKAKKKDFEEEIEDWIKERKKFLIKLGWVAGGIIVLVIISNLFLKVKGFG